MNAANIVPYVWLAPAFPLLAAGVTALAKQRQRKLAAGLSIGAMSVSLVVAIVALVASVEMGGGGGTQAAYSGAVFNFPWFQLGTGWVELGWVLEPLTGAMLVMVTLVSLLIFIFSVGYMSEDANFTRFYCFLSLFAAGMLGLVIANSLLLFFICWEVVGLTSYLLIGFWYHKPSAAAAAKKAFITTRIGDLAFLLGIVWLYAQSGTLLFYDGGNGCLEQGALARLVTQSTTLGLTAATGIGLLIFCGAIGKSGQVPLHVWLPDAMEGPTPVSALIHAATMVAAGVFLVARVYPLMAAIPQGGQAATTVLQVVTWVGAITAVFAATIAVAQNDIKRILAYSTVSQLGYMMMGLGVGGVAVGMFHLITHAFFKALLFLGAGSVIHGCHEEQDIRRMGNLRKFMPVTFATYAVGMLALSGFPLLFSGFWSKDEILHAAHGWPVSRWPFYLGLTGAFLTAFYMTRQVWYVFFGPRRAQDTHDHRPHESPRVMLAPLVVLAAASMLLSCIGTPAWPWFVAFLESQQVQLSWGALLSAGFLGLAAVSAVVVLAGIGAGWLIYSRQKPASVEARDPLARWRPDIFTLLARKYYVDEVYEWSIVRPTARFARACAWVDRYIFSLGVELISQLFVGLSWANRALDELGINLGFDRGCLGLSKGGWVMSALQNGRVQDYLRALGVAAAVLALLMLWGCA